MIAIGLSQVYQLMVLFILRLIAWRLGGLCIDPNGRTIGAGFGIFGVVFFQGLVYLDTEQ